MSGLGMVTVDLESLTRHLQSDDERWSSARDSVGDGPTTRDDLLNLVDDMNIWLEDSSEGPLPIALFVDRVPDERTELLIAVHMHPTGAVIASTPFTARDVREGLGSSAGVERCVAVISDLQARINRSINAVNAAS